MYQGAVDAGYQFGPGLPFNRGESQMEPLSRSSGFGPTGNARIDAMHDELEARETSLFQMIDVYNEGFDEYLPHYSDASVKARGQGYRDYRTAPPRSGPRHKNDMMGLPLGRNFKTKFDHDDKGGQFRTRYGGLEVSMMTELKSIMKLLRNLGAGTGVSAGGAVKRRTMVGDDEETVKRRTLVGA